MPVPRQNMPVPGRFWHIYEDDKRLLFITVVGGLAANISLLLRNRAAQNSRVKKFNRVQLHLRGLGDDRACQFMDGLSDVWRHGTHLAEHGWPQRIGVVLARASEAG
jgi:hypothetical protein